MEHEIAPHIFEQSEKHGEAKTAFESGEESEPVNRRSRKINSKSLNAEGSPSFENLDVFQARRISLFPSCVSGPFIFKVEGGFML